MSSDIKIKVQSFGRFLSNMVMPNIGAFIAWGIITALFIPTGWLPNETLAKLVGPMITYLLPVPDTRLAEPVLSSAMPAGSPGQTSLPLALQPLLLTYHHPFYYLHISPMACFTSLFDSLYSQ